MKSVPTLIAGYAVLLALCGAAFLFAPGEVGALVGDGDVTVPQLAQLFGAALLGFGAANWIARRSMLGGIYGRSVVAGNLAFAFVGALSLLGNFPDAPGPTLWVLLVILGIGSVLFGWLMFRGPRSDSSAPGR